MSNASYRGMMERPFGFSVASNFMSTEKESKSTKQSKYLNVGFTDEEYKRAVENAQGVPLAKAMREAVVYPSHNNLGDEGVPLMGFIHAGEEGLDEFQCKAETDRLIICSEFPHGPQYGYLYVEGDCMNKQIPEGAIALFRRKMPRSGDTVAVMITWPDLCEFCLRVITFLENGDVLLSPDSYNEKYKPILLSENKPKDSKYIWLQPERADPVGIFTGDYIFKKQNKK